MSKKAAIPKSRARTAYGLLSEIVALVKAEPRRMRMAAFRTDPDWMSEDRRPACGTIGCVAGWVTFLKKPGADGDLSGRIAPDILGIDGKQQEELFYGPLTADKNQCSRGHGQRVITMIRAFQKKYAAQLKAKRV